MYYDGLLLPLQQTLDAGRIGIAGQALGIAQVSLIAQPQFVHCQMAVGSVAPDCLTWGLPVIMFSLVYRLCRAWPEYEHVTRKENAQWASTKVWWCPHVFRYVSACVSLWLLKCQHGSQIKLLVKTVMGLISVSWLANHGLSLKSSQHTL